MELGGTVIDVTVEHPLYGEITGNLQCRTLADVEQFVEKMQAANAEPLLVLTDGLHLHTIAAPDEETMVRIIAAGAAGIWRNRGAPGVPGAVNLGEEFS